MSHAGHLEVEIDEHISLVRENLRQSSSRPQAAGQHADDELVSRRISEQEARLSLDQERRAETRFSCFRTGTTETAVMLPWALREKYGYRKGDLPRRLRHCASLWICVGPVTTGWDENRNQTRSRPRALTSSIPKQATSASWRCRNHGKGMHDQATSARCISFLPIRVKAKDYIFLPEAVS